MIQDTAALDRFLIRELIDRYSYAVNARDWTTIADCFTEDAVWDVGPPFNLKPKGRANVVHLLSQMTEQNDFVLQMPHATMVWLEGDRARAHSTMQEIVRSADGASGIQLLATYADRIVRETDQWRFEVREFRVVNVHMAAPLGSPPVT